MTTSGKFCLKWNEFQENVSSTLVSLREDKDFADVTLACEDGHQWEGHKIILAASSPFFQNLLKRNKHSHPLIYMRGMKSSDLVAMVDFLYHGEANILQENLLSFLAIADELELKGLTGINQEPKKEECKFQQKRNVIKSEHPHTELSQEIQNINYDVNDPVNKISSISQNTMDGIDHKVSVGLQNLDETIKSMITYGARIILGSQAGKRIVICSLCGKEGQNTNIRDHIEATHIEGVDPPCNFCDKTFKSRQLFRRHNTSKHNID